MKDRMEIRASNRKDLQNILAEFGMEEEIEKGKMTCRYCAEPITWENLGGYIIENTRPVLFCDLLECLEMAKEDHLNG